MDNLQLIPISGVVQRITRFSEDCCKQLVTIRNQDGESQLVISPETYVIDTCLLYTSDKCKKCGMCMKPGCPAMTRNADGTIHIDDTMCTGCGLCATLCKFDAIELVKAGDR